MCASAARYLDCFCFIVTLGLGVAHFHPRVFMTCSQCLACCIMFSAEKSHDYWIGVGRGDITGPAADANMVSHRQSPFDWMKLPTTLLRFLACSLSYILTTLEANFLNLPKESRDRPKGFLGLIPIKFMKLDLINHRWSNNLGFRTLRAKQQRSGVNEEILSIHIGRIFASATSLYWHGDVSVELCIVRYLSREESTDSH